MLFKLKLVATSVYCTISKHYVCLQVITKTMKGLPLFDIRSNIKVT